MESDRKNAKKEREISTKNTSKNIADRQLAAAAEVRETNPAIMALYNMFSPGSCNHGLPKFTTDRYGNRILRAGG